MGADPAAKVAGHAPQLQKDNVSITLFYSNSCT